MVKKPENIIPLDIIRKPAEDIKYVVQKTPLQSIKSFSERYNATILFKREVLIF